MTQSSKQILISFLFAGSGCLSFYFLYTFLFTERMIFPWLWYFLVSLLFFLFFFIFSSLALKKSFWRYVLYFLVPALSFLFFGFTVYTAVAFIFLFLFLINGDRLIQKEKDVLLSFSFSRIAKKGASAFFTGIAVLIAILVFLSPKTIGGQLGLPRPLFDAIFPIVENIFSQQISGFSGEMTVDQYLLLQASEQLEEFKTQEELKTIPLLPVGGEKIEINFGPTEEEIREEILSQGRAQFSNIIARPVKGDEKMKDIFYEIVSVQVSQIIKPYQQAGTIGLIFIFFLLTRMVLTILSYLFLPLTFLFFLLLKKIKFFEIKIEKVDKEILSI